MISPSRTDASDAIFDDDSQAASASPPAVQSYADNEWLARMELVRNAALDFEPIDRFPNRPEAKKKRKEQQAGQQEQKIDIPHDRTGKYQRD